MNALAPEPSSSAYMASCKNLGCNNSPTGKCIEFIVNAINVWNTVYLHQATEHQFLERIQIQSSGLWRDFA